MNDAQVQERLNTLRDEHERIRARNLSLDLTRGKPSTEQLALSDALDGILAGDYRDRDGTDCRNYGGAMGITEAREFAAAYLDTVPERVMVGGNSSLQLMYNYVMNAHYHGVRGPDSAWIHEATPDEPIRFLCPSPGYDRHYSVCETLGIEMIPVALTGQGPDMDEVERLVKADPRIKGIWCVPKYSNPTGEVYSDEVVERMAQLGHLAGRHFRIMWDNAYAAHHLVDNPPQLANLLTLSEKAGTLDNAVVIGSTSKITFAGAGIAFLASSPENLKQFASQMTISTIGPDKVNQLRHVRFLKDLPTLQALMREHRRILEPKFDAVIEALETGLAGKEINGSSLGQWKRPQGGYFVLFDTQPGLASEVVRLTAEAGVKLTPAGATWPYGRDPDNSNIRLAPSFPGQDEIREAMQVFVLCVELATLEAAAG
ncbi:MAG: aminotransferase class I/II-fold pyridoxal phosphate-dependent enzyme [Pseudomonadota bacterium]